MPEDKQPEVPTESAAAKSVAALEHMGTAVKEGVASLAEDVHAAADSAMTAASGAAKHAYPQLVQRRAQRGRAILFVVACAWLVMLMAAGIAIALLACGLEFSDSSNGSGIVRSIAFFVCVLTFLISLGTGASAAREAWPDVTAPEGRVIWDLLDLFTRRQR